MRRCGRAAGAPGEHRQAGIAVFKIAFARWINETGHADLPHIIRESLGQLKAVTASTLK